MHYFSTFILFITILVAINARLATSSKSLVDKQRSCPEEYRELLRRNDEENWRSDDNNGDDDEPTDSESPEDVCEQAMDMAVRHPDFAKLDPSILLHYCPHYDQRLALAQENNKTLCDNKKQELNIMRKRQALKRKRDDDGDDSSNDDDDKRRALRRRELKKRVALRFIRKRMS